MIEPLQDEFMRRALVELILVGVAGGALGCWVVLYRLSYAAESLAHSIFPGLVLAALAGLPPIVGGFPAVLVAALAVAVASRMPGVTREVAIGVVVTALFGLGVLLALSPDSPPGLQEILFGDVLGPTDADLGAAAGLVVGVGVGLALLHGRLLAGGFDPGAARSLGAAPAGSEAALLVLLSVAIVVVAQGLGNLLVVAVFVGPAAAARRLTERIAPMLALSASIAALAGVAGLYLSYYAGTAGGASVALAVLASYLVALPLGRVRSLLRGERRIPAGATIG